MMLRASDYIIVVVVAVVMTPASTTIEFVVFVADTLSSTLARSNHFFFYLFE